MLKRIAALFALSGIALGLAACNTVEGAGKDVKATGAAIEKAADSAKPK
jgi:entericidin B